MDRNNNIRILNGNICYNMDTILKEIKNIQNCRNYIEKIYSIRLQNSIRTRKRVRAILITRTFDISFGEFNLFQIQ